MKNINKFILESKNNRKRDVSDFKNWINDASKNGNKLNDQQLNELKTLIKEYFINNIDYSSLNLGLSDKDLICDIAGYIIEAAVYDAFKLSYNVTSRSGRGLNIDGQNIYWDFSIKGLDEKFEIKSICKNGYHTGGITKSKNQKNDKNLIYIIIPYMASETGFNIDIENIEIKK